MNMCKRVTLFFCILLGFWTAGCTDKFSQQYAENIAIEFTDNPKYKMISDKDKALLSEDDFQRFYLEPDILTPELKPTDRNFTVEKYLIGLHKFRIVGHRYENEIYIFNIEGEYPKDLNSMKSGRLSDTDLNNLRRNIESGVLNPADFELITYSLDVKVSPYGVVLDMDQEIKHWREKYAKKK